MERKPYPSDLTDAQWAFIKPLIPAARPGGRPRKTAVREVLNALFYLNREGCTWRALPHDFPPWNLVWEHFCRWRNNGLIARVHDALRVQVRTAADKDATPSAAIIDSQSVRTPQKGGPTATTLARR